MQSSKVIDKKYSSGASTTVVRVLCQMSSKTPFPFKATVKAAVFKSGKETLIFLPDKLFLIQKNKIGALNYSDISSEVRTTRFVESESIPGEIELTSNTGLNTLLMYSNPNYTPKTMF